MSERSERVLSLRGARWFLEPYYLVQGMIFGSAQTFLAHFLWVVLLGRPSASTGELLLGGAILCVANTALIPVLGAAIRSIGGRRREARFYVSFCLATLGLALVALVVRIIVWPLYLLLPAAGASAVLRFAESAPVVLAGFFVLWGFTLGQARLESVTHRVFLPGWPSALSGFRLAQLSDLHIGNGLEGDGVQRVIERVHALRPDAIAVTGDLFDFDPRYIEEGCRALSALEAPLGVYVVLGNHDAYTGLEAVVANLGRFAPHLRILRDERVRVRAASPFDLVGLDDPGAAWARRTLELPELTALATTREPGVPALLLSHRPNIMKQAARLGFPLVLSGHTHGGQVSPPFFPHWNVARLLSDYDRGWFRDGATQLYVSRGAGASGPNFRINCRREVTLHELYPAEGEA